MKTRTASLLLIGAICLFTTISCNREFKTASYVADFSDALTADCPDSIHINVDIEYPISGLRKSQMQPFVDSVKTAALSEVARWTEFTQDFDSLDISQAVRVWADSITMEYREFNIPFWEDVVKNNDHELESTLNYVYELYSCFTTEYKSLRTYSASFFCYTGGVHGGSFEQNTVFDLKTGKPVREKDLFVQDYREPLSALLRQHLHESFENEGEYEGLFVKDIEPNGNFKVSEEGITYVYGEYDIAPYAYGIIEVKIPWEELKGLVAYSACAN